ncbi:peptide-methionine (S)-S-oxide reductase MsrA [Candidatus Nitrosacidococcus sp. I8]|uniref:peptide-methionine (S)-S-oxide reductase MsrA n=1 Tax=Candidatus Nitrosacidococcus sp. I8 TaxID=2942908 RepID=UPI00222641BB|nr:peptide-methionine (S)-S-oxide reductase MsrA [Candidatus Nitrosacidococcus sp. I8]CAH9018032.1 Peptide methionine sulfoxide reductase MsrA [Candidatus Nitrosacidococcus sp. I8]
MPILDQALINRKLKINQQGRHFIKGNSIAPPFPEQMERILLGMGCFWGAEKKFWDLDGVYTTGVGYSGGYAFNPSYQEVCTGITGHAEVVLVIFDPNIISYQNLLKVFWESHDPTQGMRQGNDVGTQYRSAIYTYNGRQNLAAEESKSIYENALKQAGFRSISTEIKSAPKFYYAEPYHQQYLAKNPDGYCGIGGTGISFPI